MCGWVEYVCVWGGGGVRVWVGGGVRVCGWRSTCVWVEEYVCVGGGVCVCVCVCVDGLE